MGVGMLLGHETKILNRIDAQTLQSAYKNGVLANAKDVNTGNYKAVVNRPSLISSNSTNIPNGLLWGIREVFFYDNKNVIIQITGVDADNNIKIWYCAGTTTDSTFTIGTWITMEPPVASVGTSDTLGLTKLYSTLDDKTDGTMTASALKSQFDKYVEIDNLDNYLTAFQDTEPGTSSSVRFWINTTESNTNIEQINVPQINDDVNNAVDTWSSNKIKSELDIIGRYMILAGASSDTSQSINTTAVSIIAIKRSLSNHGDADEYIGCDDEGHIVLQPGTYIINGKIQITEVSKATSIIGEISIKSGSTFTSTTETQCSECYTYVGDTTKGLQAKLVLGSMVIEVTEVSYLQVQVQALTSGATATIAPDATRIQITKLK